MIWCDAVSQDGVSEIYAFRPLGAPNVPPSAPVGEMRCRSFLSSLPLGARIDRASGK